MADKIESSAAMRFLLDDVREFHQVMGVADRDAETPTVPDAALLKLRAKLIIEETFETLRGMYGPGSFVESEITVLESLDMADGAYGSSNFDAEQVADGLGDSIYVEAGAAIAFGFPLERVWAEIQRSNLSKAGGEKRADGKILKGPNFSKPRIREALFGEAEASE